MSSDVAPHRSKKAMLPRAFRWPTRAALGRPGREVVLVQMLCFLVQSKLHSSLNQGTSTLVHLYFKTRSICIHMQLRTDLCPNYSTINEYHMVICALWSVLADTNDNSVRTAPMCSEVVLLHRGINLRLSNPFLSGPVRLTVQGDVPLFYYCYDLPEFHT